MAIPCLLGRSTFLIIINTFFYHYYSFYFLECRKYTTFAKYR